MAKGKMETYASKSAMKKHEKSEPSKMSAMEKKMGIKDVVKKSSSKASMKKMGKKK